jgi:hypothetical protein
MKSSGSRAMKPSTLSILLMLCACCAWADEVLELQPRLAEAASAQGQAYVELRDRLVSTASTNALFAAVDDTRLEWRERLVARIVLERILRGADIQALRNYDWPKDPEFNPTGASTLLVLPTIWVRWQTLGWMRQACGTTIWKSTGRIRRKIQMSILGGDWPRLGLTICCARRAGNPKEPIAIEL